MKQKLVVHFPATRTEQPFIYYLIKDYNLMVNILKANINLRKEGRLVIEVSGDADNYNKALEFLQGCGLRVLPLEQEIVWNEERCTQCGACTVICPAEALVMKRPQMIVEFHQDKCVVCEHCLKSCPARAIEAHF